MTRPSPYPTDEDDRGKKARQGHSHVYLLTELKRRPLLYRR